MVRSATFSKAMARHDRNIADWVVKLGGKNVVSPRRAVLLTFRVASNDSLHIKARKTLIPAARPPFTHTHTHTAIRNKPSHIIQSTTQSSLVAHHPLIHTMTSSTLHSNLKFSCLSWRLQPGGRREKLFFFFFFLWNIWPGKVWRI